MLNIKGHSVARKQSYPLLFGLLKLGPKFDNLTPKLEQSMFIAVHLPIENFRVELQVLVHSVVAGVNLIFVSQVVLFAGGNLLVCRVVLQENNFPNPCYIAIVIAIN